MSVRHRARTGLLAQEFLDAQQGVQDGHLQDNLAVLFPVAAHDGELGESVPLERLRVT